MVMLASQRLWRGRFVVVASLVFAFVLASFFTRADVNRRLLPVLRYTHVLQQQGLEQRPAATATTTTTTATETPTPSPTQLVRQRLPPGRCSADAEFLRDP